MKRSPIVLGLMVVRFLAGAVPVLAGAQQPVPPASGIWQSGSLSYAPSAAAQHQLLTSLKRITGIERFTFAADGRLEIGEFTAGREGSAIARRILQDALASGDIFVLEDRSNSATINFGQVEPTDLVSHKTNRHDRVWWIRLDFADFRQIAAAPRVRATFDEGFTLLHELLHALGHRDTTRAGELGECETILNRACQEVGLPLRAEYFATPARRPAPGLVVIRLRFLDGPIGHRKQREQPMFFPLWTSTPSTPAASHQPRSH